MYFLKLALLASVLLVSSAQKRGTGNLRGLLAGDEGRALTGYHGEDHSGYGEHDGHDGYQPDHYEHYDEEKCKRYVRSHRWYYSPRPVNYGWHYPDYCKYKDHESYYVEYDKYLKCKAYAEKHPRYYYPHDEYRRTPYHEHDHEDRHHHEDKKHNRHYEDKKGGDRKATEEWYYPVYCTYAYHKRCYEKYHE